MYFVSISHKFLVTQIIHFISLQKIYIINLFLFNQVFQRKSKGYNRRKSTMRVNIVACTQELFSIEVGEQEPVLEIKRKIQQLLGIPLASQTLSVSGWELLDGLDMEDYPIVTDGTKIDLAVKLTPLHSQPISHRNHNRIQITVKFSARQVNIEVDRLTETVRSLKEKIHIIDGIPVRRMLLYFSGVELEDDYRNLSEYGIGELSEIVVFFKTVNGMREHNAGRKVSVVVQTASCLLNSARIPAEMKDSNTVYELKQQLLNSNILPRDDYLFIHKQRIMREDCSLKWHGVEDGDTLYVFKGTVSRGGY